MNRIMVAEPTLGGNERKYVLDCLDTNWISSNGKYIGKLEAAFAEFCGSRHAIACNNGTTSLHLALVAIGLEPGDEVIIPTVTYIATANCVRYCHATPVLVDVEPGTLNIDPAAIEKAITPKTRGIMPVHLYGYPADMDAINAIARRHGLFVLEDAAEAHGATIAGRRVGSIGTAASFSFFGNKIVTTGEGGMLTTDDDDLAARMRLLRGQGMDPNRRYWFPVVGYNYRMTNIQAAIGLGQMEQVDHKLSKRREIARWYEESLAPFAASLDLPFETAQTRHSYWMYNIFIKDADEVRRDAIMRHMDAAGIETRPVFYPMHVLPPYAEKSRFPVADAWACRGINLPTHEGLARADVARVAESLRSAMSATAVPRAKAA
ncbi:MAG: DegT/DnrJ/EryC1/StrS family aminotransferase [Planctomycetes bacterium]|nr:DegT/DnrJ/EryC1/StrS family aminotransferase [Planctomycetota bacterium]